MKNLVFCTLFLLSRQYAYSQIYKGCDYKNVFALFENNSEIKADKVCDACLRKDIHVTYFNENFIGGIDQTSASFQRYDLITYDIADSSFAKELTSNILNRNNFLQEEINEETIAFTDTVSRKIILFHVQHHNPVFNFLIYSNFELLFTEQNKPTKKISDSSSIDLEEYLNATSRYTDYSKLDTNIVNYYNDQVITLRSFAYKSVNARKFMDIFVDGPLFVGGNNRWTDYLSAAFGGLIAFKKIDAGKIKQVTVEFLIDKDGSVREVEILSPSGVDAKYAMEIKKVFMDSKWFPAIRNYEPVSYTMKQTVTLK